MYEIKRSMYTETAHLLRDHPGACEYIHGHSYKWTVILKGEHLRGSMLMDFTDLKELMNMTIGKYDHALVVDDHTAMELNEYIEKYAEHLKRSIIMYQVRPTAEVMAKTIYKQLVDMMPDGIQVAKVICRETKNNGACYYEE